ncbi:hypothetical protein [Massilia sp. YIM B04103]|uniref:hypothetical protein n=1 Tax=Massilia sp. YIM B04103 TaxID=2963106 RepID=UPI00210E5BD9|nr:hypothetical protein [Massilia sp. YIM B04103]
MAKTAYVAVEDLSLDLGNFRTVAQKNEMDAIKAMISIRPEYFWGLMESLIGDGYLPTENILVIEGPNGKRDVKEGNRRIASLKILLGLVDSSVFDLPIPLAERIASLPAIWAQENSTVPCTLYKPADVDLVDKIVARTHGKGTKAGRDEWGAVARARHNRDKNGAAEVVLDLLEKYLEHGTNLTQEQRAKWAGSYSLSVLEEAIIKVASRFGTATGPELARSYPKIQHRKCLDEIIHAIGMEALTFTAIRTSPDLALRFGVPPMAVNQNNNAYSGSNSSETGGGGSTGSGNTSSATKGSSGGSSTSGGQVSSSASSNTSSSTSAQLPSSDANTGTGTKTAATATHDERTVRRSLRSLTLFGQNRAKLVTLRQEALKLKIKDNPIAFCFLLRSMFEISAKAYCDDHAASQGAPVAKKADGSDRNLADILKDIISHLTQNKANTAMVRLLHGPGTEIMRHEGILSITSMNQLVHSPTFTIQVGDIPTLFANIFPLLDHMNK